MYVPRLIGQRLTGQPGTELLVLTPERMVTNLTSPKAEAICDDLDYRRCLVLLGSLFRKYGPFLVEVTDTGKVMVNGGLQP
jgi:hypothetical protein